jgi:hypothetical protein
MTQPKILAKAFYLGFCIFVKDDYYENLRKCSFVVIIFQLQGDIHHDPLTIIMDINPLVTHLCVVKVTIMKYKPKTSFFNDADLIREQGKN